MAAENDRDEVTGTNTTGHEWDGIKELDTPMPRWWLWTFYATIVWGIGYTIAYPAWPLISSATSGFLGYSSRAEVAQTIEVASAAQSVYLDRIAALDVAEVAADQELMSFSMAGGAAVFRTTCSQCHGTGGGGAPGYPNLLDDAWLWGGDLEAIHTTIAYGVRSDHENTRFSQMPAFAGALERNQIEAVVEHVRFLSGQDHDAALAETGAGVFAENCAACHGDDAKGMVEMGAPDLTDVIWLYGGDHETLMRTVTRGRGGVMPAWSGRLTEAQIKEVAVYVHSLGGGE